MAHVARFLPGLLLAVIATATFGLTASQAQEARFNKIFIPFSCSASPALGVILKPDKPKPYRLVSAPLKRDVRVCTDLDADGCSAETIEAYSFEMACTGGPVQWRQVAEQITKYLGGGARFYDGYLQFQFRGRLKPWNAEACDRGSWPDTKALGAAPSTRFPNVGCSQVGEFDRQKWFIEFPNGFAPLQELGVRTEFDGAKPEADEPAPAADKRQVADATGTKPDDKPGPSASTTPEKADGGEATDGSDANGKPSAGAPASGSDAQGTDRSETTPEATAPSQPGSPPQGGTTAPAPTGSPGQGGETPPANSTSFIFQSDLFDILFVSLSVIVLTGMIAAIGLSLYYRPAEAGIPSADPLVEEFDMSASADEICAEILSCANDLIEQIQHRLSGLASTVTLRRLLVGEIEELKLRIHTMSKREPQTNEEWQQFHAEVEHATRELRRIQEAVKTVQASLLKPGSDDYIPKNIDEALEILGANENTSEATLKRLVDALRATWHPDHAVDKTDREFREERIKQINVAWEILSGKRPVDA